MKLEEFKEILEKIGLDRTSDGTTYAIVEILRQRDQDGAGDTNNIEYPIRLATMIIETVFNKITMGGNVGYSVISDTTQPFMYPYDFRYKLAILLGALSDDIPELAELSPVVRNIACKLVGANMSIGTVPIERIEHSKRVAAKMQQLRDESKAIKEEQQRKRLAKEKEQALNFVSRVMKK